MARVTLTLLVSLVGYLAYSTLSSEAQPIESLLLAPSASGSSPGQDSGIEKLQTWLKESNLYRRRIGNGRNYAPSSGYQPYRRSVPLSSYSDVTDNLLELPSAAGDGSGRQNNQRYDFDVYFADGTNAEKDQWRYKDPVKHWFEEYGPQRAEKRAKATATQSEGEKRAGAGGDQFDDYGFMRFG
ncbi:uncharacterized protein LOC128723408 [Anopheles nili]|uniref:uncharacterized protein LOC128723408 n=1 Tax=Anopheles nili TaxID=185578 RepID=UPI00237C17BF|nr:uncharacterized protein LOC128723408 [Anopheles nili]